MNMPAPSYANYPYGSHYRNRFDIWLAESSDPRPLVIFYHGGGFVSGDKSNYDREDLMRFLQAKISFATVNYRYYNQNRRGILGSLNDCRRALPAAVYGAPLYII